LFRLLAVSLLVILTLISTEVTSLFLLIPVCLATAFFIGCSIETTFRVKAPLGSEGWAKIISAVLLITLGVVQATVVGPWSKASAVAFLGALLTGAALARWIHHYDNAPGGGHLGNFHNNHVTGGGFGH